MSQSGALSVNSGGGATIETITGNSGGAVGPDASFNINLLGNNNSGINVVGVPATNMLTVSALQATTSQRGTVLLATNAQAIAGTDTSNAVTSSALGAKLGTQTAHSLAVFEGTAAALTALGVASNGQLPIGSVGADPVLANITSSGGTVSITNGAGSISLDVNGSLVGETITGNTGGALSPTAGNWNILGNGSTTAVGSGSTLTVELTGLTTHAVLVGAGTTTITKVGPSASTGQVLQNNSGADPTYSTATYPSTTTVSQILYSSSSNIVAGLATANQGVLTTGTGGVPVITPLAVNGQLIVGSTAGAPAAATLTAGAGIAITNGSNSITIAATGSETVWTDENVSFNALVGNGYFVTATATATLPASPSQGNPITFVVDGTQFLTITANTGQIIRIGSAVSATAGTAVNNARGDSVSLVFRSSDSAWLATSVIGTWTVT
jgi:hypothetical protein